MLRTWDLWGFNRVAVGIFSCDDLEGLSSFGYEVLGGRKCCELGKLGKNIEKKGGSWYFMSS
jgi:hypothetical protein